ncbi:Thiol:disulfide interchange protein DsbD [anaerobic digester metagenome]
MKKLFIAVIGLVVLTAALYGFSTFKGETTNTSAESLKWSTDLNSSLEEAKSTDKLVFIDFYADWCPYCKELDEKTFPEARVQQKLSQNYVAVKVNTDNNPELASKYKIYGLPTVVILNSDGQELKRYSGYINSDELLNIL